jgi:hypothetical protein
MMQAPPALAPFHQRWLAFADKIRARVKEIEGEAVEAYKQVIEIDVLQGTGVNGVSNALKARLQGLRTKVDEAWSKIDGEMDGLDLEDDTRGNAMFRAQMLSAKGAFERELERITETMIVYGEAQAARALAQVAIKEAEAPLSCQHCGASLQRPSWCDTINVSCPSCRAVTTSTPGTAGMMFAKGAGAIALAFEAALPAWYAKQDAEHVWHSLRHKTLDDLAQWEAANRAYWQAFAETMAKYLPSWTQETIANEVRGKMSQFMEYEAKTDRPDRENLGAGVAAGCSNDPNAVLAWLGRQRDRDSKREELVNAFLERGWKDHARWIAGITGMSAEDLADCEYYLATRGD